MIVRTQRGWAVVRNGVVIAEYRGAGGKRRALARLHGVSPC